jgi:hypothetical protein
VLRTRLVRRPRLSSVERATRTRSIQPILKETFQNLLFFLQVLL